MPGDEAFIEIEIAATVLIKEPKAFPAVFGFNPQQFNSIFHYTSHWRRVINPPCEEMGAGGPWD
jgi:hypothetical protein